MIDKKLIKGFYRRVLNEYKCLDVKATEQHSSDSFQSGSDGVDQAQRSDVSVDRE